MDYAYGISLEHELLDILQGSEPATLEQQLVDIDIVYRGYGVSVKNNRKDTGNVVFEERLVTLRGVIEPGSWVKTKAKFMVINYPTTTVVFNVLDLKRWLDVHGDKYTPRFLNSHVVASNITRNAKYRDSCIRLVPISALVKDNVAYTCDLSDTQEMVDALIDAELL